MYPHPSTVSIYHIKVLWINIDLNSHLYLHNSPEVIFSTNACALCYLIDEFCVFHYNDVTLSVMAFQITSSSKVCSTICLSSHQRKPALPALCEGNSQATGEFPSQRVGNAECVSIVSSVSNMATIGALKMCPDTKCCQKLYYVLWPAARLGLGNGPLTRYVKLRVAHAPGMPGTFSPPPT